MPESEARKAFDEELRGLVTDLQDMGAVVEHMLIGAMEALDARDPERAREVMEMDNVVDAYNLGIEARALRMLALQQPMARDLRTIAAAMKIITDIERAGDYAFDIAKVAERLSGETALNPPEDMGPMAARVREMLRDALKAFTTRDLDLVQKMISHDADVDRRYYALYDELLAAIQADPSIADQAMGLLLIARYLERIADHITNIGERIYFMETGVIRELHQ